MAARNRCGRSETYWAIAARATSCIDRPSCSAFARKASVSDSLSRKFIAMDSWYRSGTTLARSERVLPESDGALRREMTPLDARVVPVAS